MTRFFYEKKYDGHSSFFIIGKLIFLFCSKNDFVDFYYLQLFYFMEVQKPLKIVLNASKQK